MSLPLREHLPAVAARVANAAHVLVGLDFDGTLAPIVDDPSNATLNHQTRETVKTIASYPGISVAIISGRSLPDVQARVGIEGLIYAGNHGLEISGPEFRFVEPGAIQKKGALASIARTLHERLRPIPGAVVENKELTITVHCRQVAALRLEEIFQQVEAALAVAPDGFRIGIGNEVVEICPCVDWHKGAALAWIAASLKQPTSLTIYIGDDRTDEDAFRLVQSGITVKVGRSLNSFAYYHVDGPADVERFLRWLADLHKEGLNRD